MWLWQAEGPQTGTGADETFAPGHRLPHSPPTKYAAVEPSLPHHHQSVSDSSWDVSSDGLLLRRVCSEHTRQANEPSAWKTTPIRCRTRRGRYPAKSHSSLRSFIEPVAAVISVCHAWMIYIFFFLSKCQAVISLTSKRRWQLSRSVSLWWTSTMAGHWLGRSSTCPPVTNHWARGGKRAECSFIGAR